MPDRRFPPPWTVEVYRGISYIVRNANKFPVAYVYFEANPARRFGGQSDHEGQSSPYRREHRQAAEIVVATGRKIKAPA